MTPKRIILVRHGESEANVNSDVYSLIQDWQINLTERGMEQAREAGRRIGSLLGKESFGVFVSPYRRTLQTKDGILEGMGRRPVFDYQDPELREQEFGNKPSKEVNKANRDFRSEFGRFFYRFPEGESCADVYDRMSHFLDSLYRRFDRPTCPENILIVSHGAAIQCFVARWYHWGVERFDSNKSVPNCHIAVMTLENDRFVLSEPFSSERILTEDK